MIKTVDTIFFIVYLLVIYVCWWMGGRGSRQENGMCFLLSTPWYFLHFQDTMPLPDCQVFYLQNKQFLIILLIFISRIDRILFLFSAIFQLI